MMKLQTLKVDLELAYLGVVGVHRILLDVALLFNLVDDDLGVAVSNEALDAQGNSDAQSVDQGLVLCAIVGRLVVDLEDVFQLTALWRDEEYA
jgi:hypothetical protein